MDKDRGNPETDPMNLTLQPQVHASDVFCVSSARGKENGAFLAGGNQLHKLLRNAGLSLTARNPRVQSELIPHIWEV